MEGETARMERDREVNKKEELKECGWREGRRW